MTWNNDNSDTVRPRVVPVPNNTEDAALGELVAAAVIAVTMPWAPDIGGFFYTARTSVIASYREKMSFQPLLRRAFS